MVDLDPKTSKGNGHNTMDHFDAINENVANFEEGMYHSDRCEDLLHGAIDQEDQEF